MKTLASKADSQSVTVELEKIRQQLQNLTPGKKDFERLRDGVDSMNRFFKDKIEELHQRADVFESKLSKLEKEQVKDQSLELKNLATSTQDLQQAQQSITELLTSQLQDLKKRDEEIANFKATFLEQSAQETGKVKFELTNLKSKYIEIQELLNSKISGYSILDESIGQNISGIHK